MNSDWSRLFVAVTLAILLTTHPGMACIVVLIEPLEVTHVRGHIQEAWGRSLSGAIVEVWTTKADSPEHYRRLKDDEEPGYWSAARRSARRVADMFSSGAQMVKSGTPDKSGRFDLGPIAPGTYEIVFSAEGLLSERTFLRVLSGKKGNSVEPEISVHLSDGKGGCADVRQVVPEKSSDAETD